MSGDVRDDVSACQALRDADPISTSICKYNTSTRKCKHPQCKHNAIICPANANPGVCDVLNTFFPPSHFPDDRTGLSAGHQECDCPGCLWFLGFSRCGCLLHFFCRIIQVDVAAFHCPVICNAHESCCAVVLAGCALHFVVLFLPGSVSMCSQPSRVVLVARFQLKHVTALIVVPGFSRGRDLPQSRIFLLDVVHNAWFAYFQWPVAKSSARAAVCSCSSAAWKPAPALPDPP